MGCRLHHASIHRIEWKGGWFNWNAEQFRDILRELDVKVWETTNQDDDYGEIEISVEEWKKLGVELGRIPKEDYYTPVLGDGYTEERWIICWKAFIDWYKEVDREYDHHNNYIRLEWF